MIFEKNKTYKVKELKKILSKEEFEKIFLPKTIKITPKPKIEKFEDFDENVKNIYLELKKHLIKLNPKQEISIWATGSRVKGTWKTKEESEKIAKDFNKNPKYSDYDFITDAKIVKNISKLEKNLNVKFDQLINSSDKVLI
jgi:hypothetical protein